jgi:hypothetical protein
MLQRKAPGTSASKIASSQQGRCLLWRQGKQRAIQKHIPRPLLAAAKNEFGPADAFRCSGLVNHLTLLGRGPQLQHLIADHDKPSDFHYILPRMLLLLIRAGFQPPRRSSRRLP